MTDWDLKTANERFDRQHKEIQRRILDIPGSRHHLATLVKAGADKGQVLRLLSMAATDTGFWRKTVRRKKQELESVAAQLVAAANRAQRVSLDPLSYGSLWLAMLCIGDWEKVKSVKELSPTYVFGLMRMYAKYCRDKAKEFGKLLRKYPPVDNRRMINCLLLHVWQTTGKYHDRELASLFTSAFQAVGKETKQFTEDQIKKHRQRYVVPRIRIHQKLVSAGQDPNSEKGTSRPR